WTMATSSMSIPVDQLGALSMGFAIDSAVAHGDETTPEQLLVYDCWVNVIFADGTSGTYRPTTATVTSSFPFDDPPGITDAANAIDGDPNTAATISVGAYSTIDFSQLLVLGAFNFPGPAATSSLFTFPDFAGGPFQWRSVVAT